MEVNVFKTKGGEAVRHAVPWGKGGKRRQTKYFQSNIRGEER